MGKIKTPDWILKDKDSSSSEMRKKKSNEKGFKIRKCPKCDSYEVNVILAGGLESEIPSDSSEESQVKEGKATGEWECKKCGWHGRDIKEERLNEEQFMKYLDEKGEAVS